MNIEKWKSQLRKGTAEFGVLLILENRELYGLEILNVIAQCQELVIAEGTIYPLLNRLRREGKVESLWVEGDPDNRPRKYYHLTAHGEQVLGQMKTVWHQFQRDLDALSKGAFFDD